MPPQSRSDILLALGMKPELAKYAGEFLAKDGLVATGTVITDALDLVSNFNYVTTSSASTGVQLPDWINTFVVVQNASGQTINIWPHSASGKIAGGAAGAAQTILTAKTALLFRATGVDWWYTLIN